MRPAVLSRVPSMEPPVMAENPRPSRLRAALADLRSLTSEPEGRAPGRAAVPAYGDEMAAPVSAPRVIERPVEGIN